MDWTPEERREYMRQYRERTEQKRREYRQQNREKLNADARKYYESHKEERLEYQKEYRKQHPESESAGNRRRYIKRTYNLTTEEFDQLLANGCQLCFSKENLKVDICPTTKKVLGCLCGSCTRGLDWFKNDTDALSKAAEYVNLNRSKQNA
jgi:hypothetical protein